MSSEVERFISQLCQDGIKFARSSIADQQMQIQPVIDDVACIYDASSFCDKHIPADFILGFWVGQDCGEECTNVKIQFNNIGNTREVTHEINVYKVDTFVPAYGGAVIPVIAMHNCANVKVEVKGCRSILHVLCAFVMDPEMRLKICMSKFAAVCGTRVSTFPFGSLPDDDFFDDFPLILLPDITEQVSSQITRPCALQRAKERHDAIFQELMEACWHPARVGRLAPPECEMDSIA